MLLQKLGTEILRRRHKVRTALGREIQQIPIGPDRVDMVRWQLAGPKMMDLPLFSFEDMHHRQLHIIGLALTFVVGLEA